MQTRTAKTAQTHRMRIKTIHRMPKILPVRIHRTIQVRIPQRTQTNTITRKKRIKADAQGVSFFEYRIDLVAKHNVLKIKSIFIFLQSHISPMDAV